jgi:hypothetical protein
VVPHEAQLDIGPGPEAGDATVAEDADPRSGPVEHLNNVSDLRRPLNIRMDTKSMYR